MTTPTDEQWDDIWDRLYSHVNLENVIKGETAKERKELLELEILKIEGVKNLLSNKKTKRKNIGKIYRESKDDIVDSEEKILEDAEKLEPKPAKRRTKKEKSLLELATHIIKRRTVKSYKKKGKTVKTHLRFVKGRWTKRQVEFLHSNYPTGDIKELGRVLKRSENSIRSKASREKVKRK